MKRIGIVSPLFDRGAGKICTQIRDAIKWYTNYEVFILARMSFTDNKKQIKYWDNCFNENIYLSPTYEINNYDFENWIKSHNLDIVIFVEEHFTKNLPPICKKLGIQTLNYSVWENVNPAELEYYRIFDYLICPTKCSYDLFKKDFLLDNARYIPWGVDLNKYIYHEPIKKDKSVLFFPAGWGGTCDRKNENAVLKSFSYVCPRDKCVLSIHTQKENQAGQAQNLIKTSGTISEYDLISKYAEADIILLPSRFEGNGLPFMEASAIGRPIITVDFPPMNERVINGINGLICKVNEMKEYQGIFVKGAEIDLWRFANKMIKLSEDKKLLYDMQINSRRYAVEYLDWYKNSKYLIDLL